MSSFKVVNNAYVQYNSLKYFPISKNNSILTKPIPHLLHKDQNISNNDITYISSSGEITRMSNIIVFDNSTKPLEVTLPNAHSGKEVKLMVSYLDGMPVTVYTKKGSFVLSYPDITRHLVSYNNSWNMFMLQDSIYNFFPTKIMGNLSQVNLEHLSGFGYSVDMSSCGQTIIVGCPEINNGSGCVYVYTFNNSTNEYIYSTTLTGINSKVRKDEGKICIINNTGNIIGFNSRNKEDEDIFIIFEKNVQGVWKMSHIIEESCVSAVISSDGTMLALGHTNSIKVYMYQHEKWDLFTELIDANDDELFGTKICISGNGKYVTSVSGKYTAVMYDISSSEPIPKYLSDNSIVNGISITTNYTGTTIIVGNSMNCKLSIFSNINPENSYFMLKNTVFNTDNDLCENTNTLSLSEDGNTLIVCSSINNQGSVYIFTKTINEWILRTRLVGEKDSSFGHSCAINNTGSMGIVSGIGNNGNVWILA